ncbi:MAG: hypothetical protein M1459_02170 [Patescibacteria group bacterium]|nr:hypothetical protein [Patescibacteria group bacterium]
MLKKSNTRRGGILKTVLIIVAILIILGYFGFNLRTIVASPTVHDNLVYVWELIKTGWNDYLKAPFNYLWNNFWMPYIWNPFIDTLIRMQGGGPAVPIDTAPQLPVR